VKISWSTAKQLGYIELFRCELRDDIGRTVIRFETLRTEAEMQALHVRFAPRGLTLVGELEEMIAPPSEVA
jgi:hypothetical protein